MKKGTKFMMFSIMLVIGLLTTMLSAYAAVDHTTVVCVMHDDGSGGSGQLTCHGGPNYSSYADTVANSSGTDENDYVYVSLTFNEYNYELTESFDCLNEGANYTTAVVTASGAYNPQSVDGSHTIRRGECVYYGDTTISY